MDYRDVIGGGALMLIGGYASIHALVTLKLGVVTQMGSGMFPVVLGTLLFLAGVIIFIPALFRAGVARRIDFRSFSAVVASILGFVLLIEPFGIVPAIFLLTAIASRADNKLSWKGVLALAAFLSCATYLIFIVGLKMPIKAFDWPR